MRIEHLEIFLKLLAPFAPHIAEELWHELGNKDSIHRSAWPAYDPELLVETTVTIAVQVAGKLRGTVLAPAGADQAAVERLAQGLPNVLKALGGKAARKVVFIPNRLINFVV